MRTTGMSLVEILIAAVIVAVAFIPLLTMVETENRQAAFNESQLLARNRARRAAVAYATHGYDALVGAAGSPAPGGGRHALPPVLPPVATELQEVSGALGDASAVARLETAMRPIAEAAWLELPEVGLARVIVSVSWRNATEGRDGPLHEVTSTKLVSRRDAGLLYRHPIVAGGGAP